MHAVIKNLTKLHARHYFVNKDVYDKYRYVAHTFPYNKNSPIF